MSDTKFISRKTDARIFDDCQSVTETWFVHHGDFGGYMDGELNIHEMKDGRIILRGGDSMITLEKEQIAVLREVLTAPLETIVKAACEVLEAK